MPDNATPAFQHAITPGPINPGVPVVSLLELRSAAPYEVHALAALAHAMAAAHDDPSDGPDPEENLAMPAGYTYLGQFVDHDLTLDTSSTLAPDTPPPNNLRTPRFDLDCVYGNGPDDQPYMYFQGAAPVRFDAYAGASTGGDPVMLYPGASLLPCNVGTDGRPAPGGNTHDLLRSPNGRAIIGDKRNDENSIVNQVQQLFIAFHNRVVETLVARDASLGRAANAGALFTAARNQVRWSYQRILVDDFLPRIVDPAVLSTFADAYRASQGQPDNPAFLLFPRAKRLGIPREFSGAAYRFGHSAVRLAYRLNNRVRLAIFPNPDDQQVVDTDDPSLVGFEPLDPGHVIEDWGRFYPGAEPGDDDLRVPVANFGPEFSQDSTDPASTRVRLQYAYKLDPSLVDPLTQLPAAVATLDVVQPGDLRSAPPSAHQANPAGPSLALLNLLRGNRYCIASGQDFERALKLKPGETLDTDKYLRVRQTSPNPAGSGNVYTFTHVRDLPAWNGGALGEVFTQDTPLWFFLLAEAQKGVVDLWLKRNGGRPGSKALDEDDLKNTVTQTDGPQQHQSAMQEFDDQGRPLNASVTRLGRVGGRIVAEVFYGLLDSDQDSVFNAGGDRPGQPFTPPWGAGRASMGKLIRFTRQRGKSFTETHPPTSF